MSRTKLQLAVESLKKYLKEAGEETTSRHFNGTIVFVHHEDGSSFIFYDAFKEQKKFGGVEFLIVWSLDIEPFYFFSRDVWVAIEYGDRYDTHNIKETKWRPIKVRHGAKAYLRKKGIKQLECKDFIATIYLNLGHTVMVLTHAFYHQAASYAPLYVFTEHHGYFRINAPDRVRDTSCDYFSRL